MCVFRFSLLFLFKAFLTLKIADIYFFFKIIKINERFLQMYIGIHVKYPLFLAYFTET
jgi:hypothetical protein